MQLFFINFLAIPMQQAFALVFDFSALLGDTTLIEIAVCIYQSI